MKELVLMIGIQASGKTTFAKSHFVQTRVYISLDVLKTRFQENLKLKQAISDSKNIVVDNTNVTKKEREKYISLAKKNNYKVIGYYFVPNVKLSLIRNRNPDRISVPQVAIFDRLKKFEIPTLDEGFDEIFQVET